MDELKLKFALIAAIAGSDKFKGLDIADIQAQEIDVAAPTPDVPVPTHDDQFPMFEIMGHKNQPDLSTYGLRSMKIWYEGSLFDDSHDKSIDPDDTPDVNVDKLIAAAKASPEVVVFDIERWWGVNGAATSAKNIARYAEAMKIVQQNVPEGTQAALYSSLPIRHYWAPVRGGSSLTSWQRDNDALAPIVEHVDFTTPSIYTFYDLDDDDNLENWLIYAKAQISEAKRIAPDVPCYPYLWPRYHSEQKAIEPENWLTQLETMQDNADGLVIWDDVKSEMIDFADLPAWWDQTERFAKEYAT